MSARPPLLRLLVTLWRLALIALLAFSWVHPARAQARTEAQQLAFDALRLEFRREALTAPEEELAVRFQDACSRGYAFACERRGWWSGGRADLQAAGRLGERSCDNGDRVACMVVAWSLEGQARSASDPDRLWRAAARILLQHCENGYTPACDEYGTYLLENRGLTADPKAALLRWVPACDRGHLNSCTNLGILDLEGAPGVPKNPRKGLDTLDMTCRKGHAKACFAWGLQSDAGWTAERLHGFYDGLCTKGHRDACWRLALAYLNHVHQPPTEDTVNDLLERGCTLGHAQSCYETARTAASGAAPDWARARERFSAACFLGDTDGCAELVDLIVEGKVDGDLRTDPMPFELACEREGHAEACNRLAVGLLTGVDLPRDPVRARTLLSRICVDANSAPASCATLGQTFEEGVGGDRDRTEAVKFFGWACYGGRFDACQRRGDLLASGSGVLRDDHEALAMYDRACIHGLPESCLKAGSILDLGTYVARDVPRAAAAFDAACKGGVAGGCTALGRLNEQGISGPADFVAARATYEQALEMDDVEARRRLARLLWNGLGGKRDARRARELSSEACKKGDAVACRGAAFL